jgi:hypothetical protein
MRSKIYINIDTTLDNVKVSSVCSTIKQANTLCIQNYDINFIHTINIIHIQHV